MCSIRAITTFSYSTSCHLKAIYGVYIGKQEQALTASGAGSRMSNSLSMETHLSTQLRAPTHSRCASWRAVAGQPA